MDKSTFEACSLTHAVPMTSLMVAPLPEDPSLPGSVALKPEESNPTQPNPPGQRIRLAANPSVLSEVLIGHADALQLRPLLPDLHLAYAPGTPVDPSVWDSQ